jgi:transcriptional regulator with XRE-family HTH domain
MNIAIGNRLRDLRRSKDMTKEALAELLGVSTKDVDRWEEGEASPDANQLVTLSRLYGVSLDTLLDTGYTSPGTYAEPDTAQPETSVPPVREVEIPENDRLIKWLNGIFPVLITVVFLILGFTAGLWHPAWMLFLLIPIYYTIEPMRKSRDHRKFCYPVLCVLIQLGLGFLWGFWAWSWVIYLTIPLYYSLPVKK